MRFFLYAILGLALCFPQRVIGQCEVEIDGYPTWCGSGFGQAIPTGGTPPYSYQWSTGDTTDRIYSLGGGTYYLTRTDSLGCMAIDTVTYTVDTGSIRIYAISAPCSTCNGNIGMNYSGGVCPPFAIQTDPPNHFGIGYPPGTYIVTITDACGCQEIDTVTVGIDTTLGTGPEPQRPSFRQIGNTLIFDQPVEEVRIYDVQGRLVRTATWLRRMELDGLVPGVYFIVDYTREDQCTIGKAILQH